MDHLKELLDSAGLKHPCDLDLLLFFRRHYSALMTSEQLSQLTGYELQQIAKSLDLLVACKVLRRSQNTTHSACLYRFEPENGGPQFQEIFEVASTIEGGRRLRDVLKRRQSQPNRTASSRQNKIVHVSKTKENANG